MYYPHLERQDQYVRLLTRIKELDSKLNEIIAELKGIHEKMDTLVNAISR
jgi:hypothetical protein